MRLSLLEEQHQPRVADTSGTLGPPPPPPGGAPAPGAPPAPVDLMGGQDPLAPPPMPQPEMTEDERDEVLDRPATGADAEKVIALAEAMGKALEPDEDPETEAHVLLTMPDQDLLNLVQARLNRATSFRAPFEAKWLQAWLDYKRVLRDKTDRWQSKVFLPLVYQQVTSAIPPMVAAIFDSGPVWKAEPTKPEWDKKARAVTAQMDYYARTKTPLQRRLRDGLFWSTLLGTCFFRSWWETFRGTKRSMKGVYLPTPDGGDGPLIGKRLKVQPGQALIDRPMVTVINPWNAYPAPQTKDDDYIPWFIERVEQEVEELLAEADDGRLGEGAPEVVRQWLQEAKPWQSAATDSTWGGGSTFADAMRNSGLTSPYEDSQVDEDKDPDRNTVITWAFYTDDVWVRISGDGTKVLGRAPNPHIHRRVPIVKHDFERIPGCVFGDGIGEVLAGIQSQVNFNYNKGNDAVQLALNSPIAVRAAGNALVQGQVAWQPGVYIPCRDPQNDIKPLEIKDPMAKVLLLEDHLLVHADRSTGVNDITRGQAPGGANTATEFAGLQSQVRIRLSQHVREIKETLALLARFWFSDIQQFVTEPTVIRIQGKRGLEFLDIKPEDLEGEFDFIPSANATRSNPAILRQDVATLTPILIGHPNIRQDKFLEHVLKVHEIPNYEEMVQEPPPPPRDPEAEEQALNVGVDIDPSPDEDFTQHLLVHQMYLQQTDPNVNPLAYAARKRHFEKTLILQSEVFQAQQGQPAPGAPGQGQPQPPGAGGGTEARQGATVLGRAQGSHGPGGGGQRQPGPNAPPGRPKEK